MQVFAGRGTQHHHDPGTCYSRILRWAEKENASWTKVRLRCWKLSHNAIVQPGLIESCTARLDAVCQCLTVVMVRLQSQHCWCRLGGEMIMSRQRVSRLGGEKLTCKEQYDTSPPQGHLVLDRYPRDLAGEHHLTGRGCRCCRTATLSGFNVRRLS